MMILFLPIILIYYPINILAFKNNNCYSNIPIIRALTNPPNGYAAIIIPIIRLFISLSSAI